MPRKPKLMFQICQKDRVGLFIGFAGLGGSGIMSQFHANVSAIDISPVPNQRSYSVTISRNRSASVAVSAPAFIRHIQLPLEDPGKFMRPSLPMPRISCVG